MYARLEDAETAHAYLTKLLGNPFPNLFNAHRHPKITFYPLTIEANFAASAGIAELLMQSHAGELHLLPALPKAWPSGRISGIRARGGYELDLIWADGKLQSAAIRASQSGRCQVRTAVPIAVEGANWEQVEDGVIAFTVEAGQSYTITADVAQLISKGSFT